MNSSQSYKFINFSDYYYAHCICTFVCVYAKYETTQNYNIKENTYLPYIL